MRFLGVGDYCDLASLYLRLIETGHEVRVFMAEPMCHSTLAGLVHRVDSWETELPWIRDAGPDGIVIFENVSDGRGLKQEQLRAQGYRVIGGSRLGDRLENDRTFAQGLLSSLGLPVASMHEFDCLDDARRFVQSRPRRYVLKFNGEGMSASDTYVGRMSAGQDVLAVLESKLRRPEKQQRSFVLMDFVEGVEMGVGAYFDGVRFLEPACLDWEHKKFFPGDLGELTGEMGTVVSYERTRRFFRQTLARLAPQLRAQGHCGYVNLNTIVNEEGIWPLEFTCRFGYPGYAILDPLQRTPWADLFKSMIDQNGARLEVQPGFSVGIVMTTPPFPYIRTWVPEPIGLPILFEGPLSDEDRANLHFGEVALDHDQLVTAGYHGWTMVVTGTAPSLVEAQSAAYALAKRVVVPDVRYRRDIGDKLLSGDLRLLEQMGLLEE